MSFSCLLSLGFKLNSQNYLPLGSSCPPLSVVVELLPLGGGGVEPLGSSCPPFFVKSVSKFHTETSFPAMPSSGIEANRSVF